MVCSGGIQNVRIGILGEREVHAGITKGRHYGPRFIVYKAFGLDQSRVRQLMQSEGRMRNPIQRGGRAAGRLAFGVWSSGDLELTLPLIFIYDFVLHG